MTFQAPVTVRNTSFFSQFKQEIFTHLCAAQIIYKNSI